MSIDFRESDGDYTGTSTFGRRWRISKVRSGWRLEFSDAGDTTPTYAGLHASVADAAAEASTPVSAPRRRRKT